jgi:hypothetical protein
VILRQESDRISPCAIGSAANNVGTVLGDDQRRIARLDYPAWPGEIGALALPHLPRQPRNLILTMSFPGSVVRDEHGTVLEQLGNRFTATEHKRVLEQRLQVLWRPRSICHSGDASSRSAAQLFQKSGISPTNEQA